MRRLYCVTRGQSNRLLSRWLCHKVVPSSKPAAGLLANSPDAVDSALQHLRENGYAVLGPRLDANDVSDLIDFALRTRARLMPKPPTGLSEEVYNPAAPRAVKYDLPEHELVQQPVIQKLLADPSLRDLARRYLRCEPVNDLVAMWWSTAYSNEANSEVAQLYHFDMDRPQFLKLFFYLTDVGPDTGPHCYVRASHRERPASLWRDGRLSDAEVLTLHGLAAEVEITAPAGTLIAVDTSGFHKGKPLVRGHRLILQIEYTSALFGQRYARIGVPATEFWREQIAREPIYLARFHLA
jgi:hypothetical protein